MINWLVIGIGDITHPMQLSNRGRNGRVLMPVDSRSSAVMFIIRKDLYDQGITTLEKLAAWKRPDDRKPIVSVSSLGGTNHVWSSYYMEVMGLDTKVTWIGTGNVDTMLGWAHTMTWKGIHPIVKLSTAVYQKGVSLSKKAMQAVEARLDRNPLLPKWDILIRPA